MLGRLRGYSRPLPSSSDGAGEVMTRDPRTTTAKTLAAEALKTMEGRITVLFVVDQTQPIGIVHVHDLLRAGVI